MLLLLFSCGSVLVWPEPPSAARGTVFLVLFFFFVLVTAMADPLAKASVSRGGDSVALLGNAVTTDPNAPLVSTSVTGDDLGIGACGDVHAESPSIARGAAPAAPTAWTGKQSFAHVVSPHVRSSTSPTSSPSLTASEIQRQQSTFIVRRAPPDMSPQGAVKTIADQMRLPPGALFESALRDPQDRRRLYLVFKSPTLKQSVASKGFKLGNVTIKPSDGALRGYIPFRHTLWTQHHFSYNSANMVMSSNTNLSPQAMVYALPGSSLI